MGGDGRHPVRRRGERGLALLLVVSLMALVTLVVVSLAVITRIEISTESAQSEQLRARENALMGLEVALGRLQRAAGPDQRVTATAEATGTVEHPHWVGVWRTDTTNTEPIAWLVSGDNPNPTSALAGSRRQIELVDGSGVVDRQVVAPLEVLPSDEAGQQTRGAFAYFIADQGLKAQLAAAIPAPGGDDFIGQRRLLMGGSRALGFGDRPEIDATSSGFQDGLRQSLQSQQWFLLAEGAEEITRDRWHDYAAWSRGLLVDPVRGGLKTDLSLTGDAAIPGLAAYADLATPERGAALSPAYPLRRRTGGGGEIYDGIHPIVTQLGLQFSVHTISATSRTLETRLRFFIELNNPYSSALVAEDLRLVITGLPREIAIEARTLGSTRDHGEATVNLEALYAHHAIGRGRPAIEFDLPVPLDRWAPGRTYNWRLQSGNTMGEAANRELIFEASTRTSYWRERPGNALDGPDALTGSSELRFTGRDDWRIEFSLQRAGGEELIRGRLPEFFAVETAWQDANSTQPDFGIEVRLVDRGDYERADQQSTWLREGLVHDPRRPRFDEEFWLPKIDLESASYNVAFSGPNSAVEARQVFNRDPVERTFFSFYQPSFNADVALFELPRQPWLSVGALQHLAFRDAPIYDVGNSWSSRNDWFDRYFFSGQATGQTAWADDSHPVVRPIDTTTTAELELSAQQHWVEGAFNVNSVSPLAWAALLRGLGGGETPLAFATHNNATAEVAGSDVTVLENPLSRFAQSAGELWEISPNPENFQAILRTYRRGVRSLTDMQVEGLAQALTEVVAERIASAGPYRSIEEFLAPDAVRFAGRNAVEEAITRFDENTPEAGRINWDNFFPAAAVPIDVAAPSYLTSADFMTALAPQLTTRSDTFVVRAYGESVPLTPADAYETTEPVAEAWVEALVQRFPEGVDVSEFVQTTPDDWRTPIADPNWGRKFRVISLRWLSPEDL